MNKERLREIFIDEATEIIEKLDIEIIDLEESPADKNLINELFRGVHTLKGSANSFGFRRMGEFVHGFEDVLDHYRGTDDVPGSEQIDLFLQSVDVIKELFHFEINDAEGVPENYTKCLNAFDTIRDKQPNVSDSELEPSQPVRLKDLSSEFGTIKSGPQPVQAPLAKSCENDLHEELHPGEQMFRISLQLDSDIYLRGQDHTTFLKLLMSEGRILKSTWDVSAIPDIANLDPHQNYFGMVEIYVAANAGFEEISELFEFLEENEYTVELCSQGTSTEEAKSLKSEEPIPEPATQETDVETVTGESKASEKPSKDSSQAPKKNEEKRSVVKIETTKLDELFDSVGELVIAQNFLAENGEIKNLQNEQLDKTIETLSKITRLIQNRVMSLRMVPIRDTFEKMKRVLRDASRKVGKEVKLTITGEDTEIDKTMVDALSDPLIHIIRNAVDHGLEDSSESRIKAGKESEGNVTLRAFHKGSNIIIEITDDGRGINRDKVLNKAIERGLTDGTEELSDQQVYAFIMQAGFSTADQISDISGRGVGLDVVRSSIEKLRGKIEVDSRPGEGSRFAIFLPLTLAIIDGMLVKSSDETFIIPTLSIVESFRPNKEIVHSAQGKGEFVSLREELLPIVRLNSILKLDATHPDPWDCTLVCAENEKGRFAILVDELIGRQQVVIKTLGKTLAHLEEISGGAVMGNGEIALILNVEGLY